MHMTNKILQGGESQHRLEWVRYNLVLNPAVLNVNLNSEAVCTVSAFYPLTGVYVQCIPLRPPQASVCVVYYVQIPCLKPSRWQSVAFSASLVAPDTSRAHPGSLWPAAGEVPLYQINTGRHYGMDSAVGDNSHNGHISKRALNWNLNQALNALVTDKIEISSVLKYNSVKSLKCWTWVQVWGTLLEFLHFTFYILVLMFSFNTENTLYW